MKKLIESCDDDLVLLDLPAPDLEAAVRAMVDLLVARGRVRAEDVSAVLAELDRKERLSSSAIGRSLAVPHAYLDCVEAPVIAIARLRHGINAGAPDGERTRFVFLLLGPTGATAEHLESLANVARLMSDDEFRYQARTARGVKDLREAIRARLPEAEAEIAPEPVVEGLQYTGRPFGGVLGDVKRRAPHWIQDIRDGLHSKCLGSTLFLFFACLAPAIIFGGLMHGMTDGAIGAVEMIVATAACGVVYALLAGQPLIILGGTGPMLIFTGILYDFCQRRGIDFLPAYAWVGFWTALILIVLSATDASCLMRFFTRFTDETFAALISLIFISEAVVKLIDVFHRAEENRSIGYDVALLTLLLALGTYYVASSLSAFRKSHLLVHTAREFLADFGPTIAILTMALIAFLARDTITLDPLPAPDRFQTTTGRPWLVSPGGTPAWVIAAAIVPAFLCSLLVFLDQNITARLVNSPDHNLHKGEAYHLDLGLVGVLIALCSVLGLPWLVAATVRSLNHVRSLATTEEVVSKRGTTRSAILHVRENRLTGIAIHVLVGSSLLLLPLLKFVPMAVLFGLFLYMGVVSMKGNQFFERLSLWATDPALYPTSHYVRRVPRPVLHGFTVLQFLCLVVLWAVKTSAFSILFPLFIAILVPVRLALGTFLDPAHLAALDADEDPEEEEESWS